MEPIPELREARRYARNNLLTLESRVHQDMTADHRRAVANFAVLFTLIGQDR
jgi:hypothetical protein